MLSQRNVYVILTAHALKTAAHKKGLGLPKDPEAICRCLNSDVREGYLSERGNRFVFDSIHLGLRSYLHPAYDIGPDSYIAATLMVRKGASELIIYHGELVGVIWDFDRSPRTWGAKRHSAQRPYESATT